LSNPFSAQSIRPGAIPFQFADDDSAAQFCERLYFTHQGRGAIIGPHGSGKTTLLRTIQSAWTDVVGAHDPPLLTIDGFEQLRLWKRTRVVFFAKLLNRSILVTAHRPIFGLPTVHRTFVTEDRVRSIIRYCLRDHTDLVPQFETFALSIWPNFSGNLRELLFALYDRYEDIDH
jgi:energy-coupling factor transporter ATP-binding protein EcfA2